MIRQCGNEEVHTHKPGFLEHLSIPCNLFSYFSACRQVGWPAQALVSFPDGVPVRSSMRQRAGEGQRPQKCHMKCDTLFKCKMVFISNISLITKLRFIPRQK